MSYPADARLHVPESDAIFVSIEQIPILRTKELTRRWEKLTDKQVTNCILYLDNYGSANNAAVRFYVTNPVAVGPRGQYTYTGKWRVVRVMRTKDDPQGITQVLRLGYLSYSGTPTDPLDQAEARMGTQRVTTLTGNYVVEQQWRYCDPADHDVVMPAMLAIKTVTSPKVEGETLSGTFACSEVKAVQNEDGSMFVSRLLTKVDAITSISDLSALTPLITQEEELINLFGFNAGDEEKLLYVYDGLTPSSQTVLCETLTAANFESIAPAAQNWKFYDRKFNTDENGTATFALLFTKETWAARWSTDRQTVQGNNLSGYLRSLALEAVGQSKVNALEDFDRMIDEIGSAFSESEYYNKGDIVSYSNKKYVFITYHPAGAWSASHVVEARYLLDSRRISDRGRGEFSVSGNMVSVYEGSADTDAVVVQIHKPITEFDRGILARVWFRRSFEAKEALIEPNTGLARQDYLFENNTYTHSTVTVEDHGDGAYTIRQQLLQEFDETADPFIIRIKPRITEWQQRMVVRVWRHQTLAGKDALTAASGLARSSFSFEGVTCYPADCHITDGEEDGYSVQQVGIELHTGTTTADALVIHIKPQITVGPQNMLQRVWLHRTTAAKNTLIGTGGAAVTGCTISPVTYTHVNVTIDDTGDGGYNVTQTLVELQDGTTHASCYTQSVKDPKSELDRSVLVRIWPYRTTAAKDTLTRGTATVGAARSGDTIETVVYLHSEFSVSDAGDGGWTVRQVLLEELTANDFMLIRIKPNITEWQQKSIARIWRHVSKTVKDALAATSGVARSSYTFESVVYSHVDVHVEDGEDNGYTVRQILIEVHEGTDDDDALITRIKPSASSQTAGLERVWLHRSTAAKEDLISFTGKARNDFTWTDGDGVLYTHIDCHIQDHGDGAYTVTQVLAELTGGDVNIFFTDERFEVQVQTRTEDTKRRYLIYVNRVHVTGSEKDAWEDIGDQNVADGADNSNTQLVVSGSAHVSKMNAIQYKATCKYWKPGRTVTWATWDPADLTETGITDWT